MTLFKGSAAPTNASNGIRTWGKFVSDGLAAIGWVKTSDTGQIDFTTVGTPGAANTSMGYEIWRMGDSLQGTTPVYMKLEYGSGASVNNCAMWITLGSGSDGAGTLTGQLTTRTQVICYISASATAAGCFVSGTSSRCVIAMFTGTDVVAAYTGRIVIVVERSHDASGNDTSSGALVVSNGYSGSYSQWAPASGSVPAAFTAYNCTSPPSGTGATGSRIDTFLVRGWMPGESSPLIGVMAYFTADLTALVPQTMNTWDGTTHTYIPCPVSAGWSYGGTTAGLLRFD